MSIAGKILSLKAELPDGVELVAVSKTCPTADIMEAYGAGQRVFGESRVQEMTAKYEELPRDIQWQMIGHLQTNKVKYIAPFVSLIQSVDSEKLLDVINGEALKNKRIIDVLLEVYIAHEYTKYGWDEYELIDYMLSGRYQELRGIRFRGLMGIATNTEDMDQVREEFLHLHRLYDRLKCDFFDDGFDTLSMGMTGDYKLAIECGSNMVRIGSYIFGERNYIDLPQAAGN